MGKIFEKLSMILFNNHLGRYIQKTNLMPETVSSKFYYVRFKVVVRGLVRTLSNICDGAFFANL